MARLFPTRNDTPTPSLWGTITDHQMRVTSKKLIRSDFLTKDNWPTIQKASIFKGFLCQLLV